MTTTEEVYFLVRTGTWGQEELDKWIQERIDAVLYGEEEEIGYEEEDEEELE
jgi:hypothetical protein